MEEKQELTRLEKQIITKEKLKKYNYIKIKKEFPHLTNYFDSGQIYKIKRRQGNWFWIEAKRGNYGGKWYEFGYMSYNIVFHFVTDEYAKKHGYKE